MAKEEKRPLLTLRVIQDLPPDAPELREREQGRRIEAITEGENLYSVSKLKRQRKGGNA